MSSELNELTTDAVPSPSRIASNEVNKEPLESNEEKITNLNDDKPQNSVPQSPFTKFKRAKAPTAQATVINIVNSSNVQVGDQKHYHFNSRSEFIKTKCKVKETQAIKSLKVSEINVDMDDLLFVATHIDSRWKDVIRSLNYSDGQIEQFYLDNHHLGIKEVIYQCLLDWKRNEPTEASVGRLCRALWDNGQRDVVKLWSEQSKA